MKTQKNGASFIRIKEAAVGFLLALAVLGVAGCLSTKEGVRLSEKEVSFKSEPGSLTISKNDEERRREYMLIRSFEMDARRTGLEQGRAEGIAQGKAEGMAQGKAETAFALKNMGLSSIQIAQATGLSKEEIEKL